LFSHGFLPHGGRRHESSDRNRADHLQMQDIKMVEYWWSAPRFAAAIASAAYFN
jgi:hypothetical protein